MEEQGIINIETWRLISAYIFVLILFFIVKARGINRERQIIIATFRMTIQLILAGYVLTLLFAHSHPVLTIVVLVIMAAFSIHTIFRQAGQPLSSHVKKAIIVSMSVGSFVCLFYFNFVIIHFTPWYEPRYFIPIAGMIIGNSMTGITLAVKTLLDSLRSNRDQIEGALMLGATPKSAIKPYVDNAFDSAILPTLNNMLGMGIVFLPGMMTGQILSGVSPLLAIEYQIVVLLGILGSVSLAVILFLLLAVRALFTTKAQLREDF